MCRTLPLTLWLACLWACSTSGTSIPDGGIPLDGGPPSAVDSGAPPIGAAQTCTRADECGSGLCGSAGYCCDGACAEADPICGTSACDFRGKCLYPDVQTPCGAVCSAGQLAESFCDARGSCTAATPLPCPTPYGCALGGTACATSCLDDTNCAAGAYCNAEGHCLLKETTGFCTSNDQCQSGLCGINGTGACCATQCDQSDVICGATACDPTSGACAYTPVGVSCGTGVCNGSSEVRSSCNGVGGCGSPASAACPGNLVCFEDHTRCKLGCLTQADCANDTFCDLDQGPQTPGACCEKPVGDTLFIDNTAGSDAPCCGRAPGAKACGSISRAMQLVRESRSYGATLIASSEVCHDPTKVCTNWATYTGLPELYPIQLGYGVTLQAPGITFDPADTNAPWVGCGGTFTAFWVSPYPEEDGGAPVTLRGTHDQPLTIITNQATPAVTVGPLINLATAALDSAGGFSARFNCANPNPWSPTEPASCFGATSWAEPDDAGNPGCLPAMTVPRVSEPETGRPAAAFLDGVTISNPTKEPPGAASPPSNNPTDQGPAIYVGPGSALSLGPNPVKILLTYDPADPQETLDGIDCLGNADQWASLTDATGGTQPVLTIAPTNGAGWAPPNSATSFSYTFAYESVAQSNDGNGNLIPLVQSLAPLTTPNIFSNELLLLNCSASLTAGPQLGSAERNNFNQWFCNYDGNGIMVLDDAGLAFGSPSQPGLIHCMGNHGIYIPGSNLQQQIPAGGVPVTCPDNGPSVQVLGATIRNNNGAGIVVGAGSLTVSDSTIVNNDIGVEVDGPDTVDSLGSYDLGCGPASVTLTRDTLACNGSGHFFQPSAEPAFRSPLFNDVPLGQTTTVNAGADLFNQWYDPTGATAPMISAQNITWTDYQAGQPSEATCDPISNGYICFLGEQDNPNLGLNQWLCQCTCNGSACPTNVIDPNLNSGLLPDGIDIVQWGPSFGAWSATPSTVDTRNGSAVPGGAASFCGNLQNSYFNFGSSGP